MKIAFLSFYSGEINRGVETHVHHLANELAKLGHEIVVYQNGPSKKEALYKTVTIGIPIKWKTKSSNIPFVNYWSLLIKKFTLKVLNALSEDIDIIIPTNGEWQYALAKVWCMRHKKKMIIAGHSGVGFDERIGLLTFPDYFIAFTDYQLQESEKRNPFIKYVKIPNGVDIDQFRDAKPLKLDLKKPIVMTASALVPMKRVNLIIEAVAKTNASLLIVGSGSEEQKLKKLCDQKLAGRFLITSVPYDQMPKAYRCADVFAFATSPWESFGIVLVEAMAAGLPIVTTDDPIRKEIVGEAGIFVDPLDTDAFAKGLQKAIESKWKDIPIKQARKYEWGMIAKQYDELFKKLI